jgi:hypothetical protein
MVIEFVPYNLTDEQVRELWDRHAQGRNGGACGTPVRQAAQLDVRADPGSGWDPPHDPHAGWASSDPGGPRGDLAWAGGWPLAAPDRRAARPGTIDRYT